MNCENANDETDEASQRKHSAERDDGHRSGTGEHGEALDSYLAWLDGRGPRPSDAGQLARNTQRLISHPELWASMGERGRRHVQEGYHLNNEAKKLEKIYLELIQAAGGAQ